MTAAVVGKEPALAEESKKIEFEYSMTNEMEELQSSNAYAEFMQIFQRFDEQVAQKVEQAKKDTSMEGLMEKPSKDEDEDGEDQAADAQH